MNASSDLLKELRIDRSAPPPRAGRGRGPWIIAAAAVLGLTAVLAWSLREQTVAVRVAQAQAVSDGGAAAAASVLDASGYVTARRIATVSSKITGKVEQVLIEEGQAVREGEVMARLEAIDASAQRDLAAARLAAARNEATRAEAQRLLAEQTLARTRDLAARQLVAAAALDQAQAERDALAAQQQAAQSNIRVAEESLALAEIGLDNTIVRAPFDGVVTVKAAQPGEMISPISAGGGFTRTGIGTVVDMDSLEIQVDVNESFIGRVKAGQEVQAVLNAYPDWRIPAEVIAIVPTADRSKATVKVRIALLEKDARVVPDMGVRVSFLEQARAADAPVVAGVTVPSEAVVQRDGRTVAFVVRDGRASQRELEVADARDGRRRVSRGLAVGEQVVLSPSAELQDGAAVVVQ
ncbi:MAG: efflux transporter periplasmic adaptor subunit [Arenimonas sp. SCN 70-307]|uniref:efflux RND transporter periplasmic adaptor subunit n=1 Tax=Arenimonas sp. SCN 70-307 TaxID=1660089 RepID=UPI00086EB363|nr:efflux RND transporter periplasmic adaptor subunit [Arenimonas sp. SCN 70-307]ODS61820.1 MAG: efflux transporter periplasmic adaptor subunit [Arenimonas sp. SCN 70-307]